MDPWTIVIGFAVCCVSALLIYVITCVSMREKTFEEVIAEQKKRQDEEREKVRSDRKMEKEHMKKKYKKGKGDKSKEKVSQVSDPELKNHKKPKQKETKMVNLEIEPEIIELSDSIVLGNQKHKNKSGARKRSILHNKDEVAPIAEKTVEVHHKSIKPLDDLELKKLHDMKTHEVSTMKKGKGQHTHVKQEVKEEKMERTKVADLQHGVAVEEKGTKPENTTVVNGKAMKGSRLIDTLRTAELSDVEVQSLIEILLNRQGAGADLQGVWSKKGQKGDPVTVLTKQLEEKERALHEEQQRATSSTGQVKELRKSLAMEREKISAMEKHYQTQLSQQEAETEALKARMSNIHTSHIAEAAKVKLQVEQLESEKSAEAAMCVQLQQEKKILQESLSKAVADNASKGDVSGLKQKVSIMEKELSNNAVRLNASENAKKSSEEKMKKLEEQIKNLESSKKSLEDSLKKQVSELKEEAHQKDSQNTQLSNDLKKATSALSTVEGECAMWKTKLKELEEHLSSLGDVGAKLQESERKKEEREGSMKNMEKQLAEVISAQKDASAKLQESEDKKQELEGNLKNLEKQLTDAVNCQEKMSSELQNFRQENLSLRQELKTAQEKQQTQASSSAAANGDASVENDVKNFIQTAEHERIVSEKVAELTKVQAALEAQTQKNNELRQKNWKAMEALENTEKLAAKKIDSAIKASREEVKQAVSEMEKVDREVLKRLFPAVSLSDNMGHKDWLASFEKQAAQLLERTSSSEKIVSEKLNHLAEENSRLQADVEVFKNNIAILHSEKDRIHELETENRKLQQQSETYEKNFVQLNADQERLLHIEEENQRLKSMSSTNISLSEDVSRLTAENRDLYSRLQAKEESITEAENKLHDLQRVVETEEKKWKAKLKQAEETLAKESEPSNREQELEDLTIQQQTQIEHYRTVLTNTEQLLRQLEGAEKTSDEKFQASQEELQKSKSECKKAQEELHALRGSTEDLSDLGFAYRCVEKSLTSIVDEMQGKMDDLQEELRQSSEHVDKLTRQNEELTSKVIVLESQNKAIAQVDREDLMKELEEVKSHLEGERKRNKELSSTLVRLNGIIKTGQDALSQEQQLVKQLQEQLTDRTKGSGSSASQEIEQLRNKLSEKEKQLEREIAANKQLSQRLGTSSLSDQGTSV